MIKTIKGLRMELETLRRTQLKWRRNQKGSPASRKCKGKPCKYNEPSRKHRGSGVKEEDLNLITKGFKN